MIGDVHPGTHWLGYVKYYPDERGDRTLFGRTYRQNTVVSKAFGILADRPECYVYSPAIGCVITGVPREDVVIHYSCRQALATLHETPSLLDGSPVGQDLLAVIGWIMDHEADDVIGVTGSFLVGVALARITDHHEGLATPALYGIDVETVIASTIDEAEVFARRITHLRSYLGAYTGAFRQGDTVHLSGRLVYIQGPAGTGGFGIELTPWSATESYLANLAR
ncbi:hypothetical protein ACIOHW_28800 [Streptomyces anulatus]